MRRSTRASRTSTRRTSTAAARASASSARRSRVAAAKPSSRRSSAWARAAAGRRSTFARRSRRRWRSLRTDHVDLLYYHRPDGVTPIAETLGAMHELVEAGKVRHLGVSNMDAAQLREAAAAAPVAVVQNRYSLLERGAEDERAAGLRGARHRLRAVLPARERPAHRQVPPRRAGAAGNASRRAGDRRRDVRPDRGARALRRRARPHAARARDSARSRPGRRSCP